MSHPSLALAHEPVLIHHWLPNELLSSVFEAGLPTPVFPQLSPGHRGRAWASIRGDYARELKKYQTLLGSICRLWREISHSTPSLWATLIVSPPLAKDRAVFYDDMLEAVLRYSGDVKLDIIAICGVDRANFSPKSHSLLTEVTSRARSLAAFQCTLFSTVSSPARLTTLRIRRNAFWKTPDHLSERGVTFFKATPRELEVIEYNDPYSPIDLSAVTSDKLRILSYEARSVSGDVKAFLERCDILQELHVTTFFTRSYHTFTAKSLRLLTLEGDGDFDAESHLPFTGELPKLSHLSMRLRTYSAGPNQADTSRNWPKLPSLRTLSLSSSPVWPLYLDAILERAPRLAAVEIWDRAGIAVLQCLLPTATGQQRNICRELRLIRVVFAESPGSWQRDLEIIARRVLKERPDVRLEWYEGRSSAYGELFPNAPVEVIKRRLQWSEDAGYYPSPALADLDIGGRNNV